MDPNLKMSDLTPEQQKQVKKIGKRFLVSAFLRGLAGLVTLVLLNVVISIVNVMYFQSKVLALIASTAAAVFVLMDLSSKNLESAAKMREDVKKVVEKKE